MRTSPIRIIIVLFLILFLLCGACLGGLAIGAALTWEEALPPWILVSSPTPLPTPSPTHLPRTPTLTPTSTPLVSSPALPQGESGGSPVMPPPDLPEPDFEALAKGLAPQARELLTPEDRRPRIQMALRIEPEQRRLRGRMRLTYWNREGVPLSTLCFRTFANARAMGGSRIEVSEVQVTDQAMAPVWSPDRTAFTLTLASPLPPGEAVEVKMIFTTTLRVRASGYGLMRAHPDGRMVIYYGYPEVARIEQGRCVLDPPWENGDLHQAEAAHFWIRLAIPEGMEAAVSGVEIASQEDEREIVVPFARNVVMIVGQMDRELVEQDGMRVNGFFVQADGETAAQGMGVAVDALTRFSEAFGPYPFPELDVVEVPLSGGAAGVEASGLVMIGEDVFGMSDLGAMLGEELDIPGFVIAHEVAHQWWYGVVGNDAHLEPWLDEGLTNWSAVFWVGEAHGKEAADLAWDALVLLPYRMRIEEGDLPLNLPAERYSELDYVAIVYGKGAWMFEVLRQELGEERFFTFLRRYLDRHRFGWATGESWKETLTEVWGREEAEAFYEKWVAGSGVTEEDLPGGGMFGELLSDPGLGEMLRVLLQMLMASQP